MKIKPQAQRGPQRTESQGPAAQTKEKPRLQQPSFQSSFTPRAAGFDAALGSTRLGSAAATTGAKQPTVQSLPASSFDPNKLSSQLKQGSTGLAQIDLGKAGLSSSNGSTKSWVTIDGQDADGNFQLRDLKSQESFKLSADKLRDSLVGGVVTVGPIEGELSGRQRNLLRRDLLSQLRDLGIPPKESRAAVREFIQSLSARVGINRIGNDGGGAIWNN